MLVHCIGDIIDDKNKSYESRPSCISLLSHVNNMRSGNRKRAAAAAAEGKIKRNIEAINRESDVERSGKGKFASNDASTRRTSHARKKAKYGHSGLSDPSSKSSTSPSSGLVSSDDWSTSTEGEVELNSAMRQRQAHLERRAARNVNSSGPMYLSRRISHRIKKDTITSPVFSPIRARRLTFSPEFRRRFRRAA